MPFGHCANDQGKKGNGLGLEPPELAVVQRAVATRARSQPARQPGARLPAEEARPTLVVRPLEVPDRQLALVYLEEKNRTTEVADAFAKRAPSKICQPSLREQRNPEKNI